MLKKLTAYMSFMMVVGSHTVGADLLLYDMAFNINGDVTDYLYDGSLIVNENNENATTMLHSTTGFSSSTLNNETGLGTISLRYDAPGNYSIGSFFDIEMNLELNSFFNETADIFGTPQAGLDWEVDEPSVFGDIRTFSVDDIEYTGNFEKNDLDNLIFNGNKDLVDDISIGFNWNFTLEDNQYAVLTYSISTTAPVEGFYITQTDMLLDDDGNYNIPGDKIYFTSNIDIRSTQSVPEPATNVILATGALLLFFIFGNNKKKRTIKI